MKPDDLNRIDGGGSLSIGQVPPSNLLQEAASLKKATNLEQTVGKLAEQIQGLEVQVKNTLNDVEGLKGDAEKLNKSASDTQQDTKDLQDANKQTHSLVVVGLYILIAMLVAVVIAATVFEIQFLDSNNQKTVNLLQQINDKVSK